MDDAINAAAQASLAPVAPAAALEPMFAPRARFDAVCLTPAPSREAEVARMQERIELLRAGRADGRSKKADKLHAAMLGLMVEKWRDAADNLVTTGGKNDLLDKYLAGSAYTAAWYCGLISSVSYTAIAAADTMASHAGWTEAGPTNAPNYSQSTRVALAFAAASGASKATSAASSFTFSGAGTIKGMFASSVSTKDGTTGILYNAVLFTGGDRIVANLDVVNVSVTYTA